LLITLTSALALTLAGVAYAGTVACVDPSLHSRRIEPRFSIAATLFKRAGDRFVGDGCSIAIMIWNQWMRGDDEESRRAGECPSGG
jgi:hypothetical protein